ADYGRDVRRVAQELGVRIGPDRWVAAAHNQAIFYASHYGLFGTGWRRNGNHIGVAYLHGRPGTPGMPEHDEAYTEFRSRHAEIDRVQVTCRGMEELVLDAGAPPEKVFLIPIGIQ